MAIRINLFSKWLLTLVLFQLICIIGLSVGSDDDDLSISSSQLTGSLEDLKSDFSFESEGQSPAGSLNSNLKTSEALKLKKNGNLLENDEYIIQDDESEDDGYIVQDDELEDEYIVQDDESEGDGYNVQDDKNDLLELQSKISSKSTSDVHTPDDNRAQNIKPFDDSNGIPTGRKDVYHYGNASPKTQNSVKHTEATSSSDDGKTDGVDATQPPKKSKLSTWEKAQLMMMKRNKNKMEKETQQKGDEIIVGSPFISLDAKASSSVSEKSLDVKHSDSSPPRNESSEDIDLPQSGKLSSNDVFVEDSAIEESREKFIKHPVSLAQEDRHESVITTDSSLDDILKGDIDNNLESRRDKDKEMPHQDQDSKRSDSKVSLIEESNQSKIITLGKDEGDGTIDHKAGDGISEDNIDSSQGNDEDQDTDDAGGQESDGIDIESESISDLENVKEVKNEIHAAENRDSLDSKVLSSSKDDFKDEIVNSSNSVEVKNEIHAAENRDSKVLSSSKDDSKDEIVKSSNSVEVKNEIHAAENRDSKVLSSSKDDSKDEIVISSNSVEVKNEIHAAENRDSKVLSFSKDDPKDEIVNSSNSVNVKNEIHAAENRDSLDSKVLSSSKDDFKDEIASSSNSEEGSARNLTNESISNVKDVALKSTTYVEKGAVEKVNITSDVLTREELKVDLQHIYPDDGTSDGDITANDTDGDQANNTKDMNRVETDDNGDNNKDKNKDGSENETLGRDDVSTAGNDALFDEDTLNSQTESLDDHSVKDQTNLVDKGDSFENMEDEQDIKEDKEKDSEEIIKDSHSSDSVHYNKNSSGLSKDVYDGNDIKQVNESGAKEGPVKEESKKDDDEGTQMSESLIRDVSDSGKSDGKELDEDTKDIEIKEDNIDIVEDSDEIPKDAEESNKDSHSSNSVHDNKNSSELSKDIHDGNDIKQNNESGAKEGPVKEESKKDYDEGTQMSESLIRDVSDSDKSDGKEMDENTKDIEIKEVNMDIVEDNDKKTKDAEEINKDSHTSDSVPDNKNSSELSKDVYDGNDIKQVNESEAKEGPVKEESKKDDDKGTQMSDGKEMDEDTKDIEIKEDNMDIVEDNDEKPKDAEGSENDEDVEAGEDTVEGTDERQADNYMDEEEDVNVDENIEMDDEHVDNDAKEVEGNDENGSENADVKKLRDDPMDGYENHVNDDKNIEKVYRNAHKEGDVRDNVAKDGEKINFKNADGNTRNIKLEVIRDKNGINEEKKQVVDKLPNNQDENISDNNKSPKKEQVGDKKGPKDAGKDNENVEVSLDSKDDESGNKTFDEPSKDDDGEISDVDDFEGIKKDDNGIAKNDEGITKDDNSHNDVNEKDSKTSIDFVVDTNEKVNKTSSNHTTARNATNFEDIHSKKMQKDDSFGEGITDNKTLVNEDNQTSTSARTSEGKMLNKDVIDGGDAPGLIFEDVPTYVEITRDHDEQGINADINDSTVNVDVDGDADGPIAFDPTPASSLEASPSNKDATADSEEMPTEYHEKDSETSVKDIYSEKLDVSMDKNVVDSLEETSHFETSTSQEADKESAKNKDFSNIVSEVDKDISNYIETTETSNVEYEEVMPHSTVDTNEYEVHPNIADERKAISTPETQEQVGSHELEIESLIEGDEKNVDDIPQELDVSTGQFFPSEHVKAKDESQSVEDDSDFSDIPSQIDNPKITTNVEDEKMIDNERLVGNEKLRSASEEMTEAKDYGKIADNEDVKADEKMVENLDVKDDGKMVEDLSVKDDGQLAEDENVKADEKMAEDLNVKDYGKIAEDEDVKADEKMVENLDVKDEGNMEKDVEKYFQDTTLQSTKKDWVFFTIKPYISLLNTVMKKLDPIITGIIFMLPPSLQNIFLKAPFNMYPTHAFLLFILSCLSLFVISFSKIVKGNRQHSRSKELKEMLFETKGVLLLSQVERDEAEQKLQDLKAKLKQKDDDLESGTAEMNKNLKALIKECDKLKEEVSRRMGSSKEMKGELKKSESDIQKQSHANKELQESIMSAKSHMQKLQEKRDQLQSSIDESELNSMKLEEKIQCLSEDVEAVEESYDQLKREVESNLKESGELQTTVDLLKKRCSKKSVDIETKEKENKILREAIVQLKIMKHLQEEDQNDDDNDDGCDDDKKREKLEERIKHLIYIAQTRIRMDEIEEQKESLKKSLTGAAEKKMDLNDELKITMEEMERVEKLREDAERQATASTMKIDVLSDYYKQREKEYNKMLQEKEAKEKAISSQKKSANERYKEADKMVADYKNQVEVLNQELERIGIHYEKQMALQENKLQENLVFVKQTERDYNIKVKEAEIMRQKLLQYRERINLLESMMASHKSTETLNTSQTKEDIRPASRNLLLRENMPSPPNFMPPSFSPHPSSLGPIPPQFFNPPPFMMRHPFIPPRLPMRSREDSPTLQRIRDVPSDDFLDERDHYPTSRTRSPLRFGPSPACRNRSSPVDLKDKYTPLANNRPLDPFYMEKGDGSHRTKYNDK